MPFTEETLHEKPYNRCIKCEKLGVICDGPNFLAMTQERFCEWCKLRKEHLGWTHAYLAELSEISEVSVSRILSGRAQGIHVETMRAITKALVNGSWGKYPCGNTEPETVYVDSPELVERVRQTAAECDMLRGQLADSGNKVQYLKEQMTFRGNLLTERADFLRQKDRTIRILSVLLAVFAAATICLLLVFAVPDMMDGTWGRIRY